MTREQLTEHISTFVKAVLDAEDAVIAKYLTINNPEEHCRRIAEELLSATPEETLKKLYELE